RARTPSATWRCRTIATTSSGSASARTSSTKAEATRPSTASSPGATRTRSSAESGSTLTPAPTTSASSRSATPGSPMSSVSLPCCCSGEPGIALGSTEEEAMAADIHEQLTKYLTDAHSIEQQALAQLRTAPDLAGDPEIAAAFRQHLTE